MKKLMAMMGIVFGLAAGLMAEEGTNDAAQAKAVLQAAVLTGSQAAVLGLLGQPGQRDFDVHRAAMMLLPADQRLAYADALTNAACRAECRILALPKGRELNAELVAYFSAQRASRSGHVRKFDAASATKDECVAFYRLCLKNIQLSESTKADLSRLKGELLKLSDI